MFRNTGFVSIYCNPSGRLPRYARNDIVLRTAYNKSIYSKAMKNAAMLRRFIVFGIYYLFMISKHCAKNCVAFSIASILTRSLMA